MLVGYTELPVADVGIHTVQAASPIPVQRGDFIGVFYSRRAEEGVVGHARQGDINFSELYQNYLVSTYKENLDANPDFSLERVAFEDTSAAFAVRALMDYTGSVDGRFDR